MPLDQGNGPLPGDLDILGNGVKGQPPIGPDGPDFIGQTVKYLLEWLGLFN
jgi:hypothetical protein